MQIRRRDRTVETPAEMTFYATLFGRLYGDEWGSLARHGDLEYAAQGGDMLTNGTERLL
jgi:hypothetical protein